MHTMQGHRACLRSARGIAPLLLLLGLSGPSWPASHRPQDPPSVQPTLPVNAPPEADRRARRPAGTEEIRAAEDAARERSAHWRLQGVDPARPSPITRSQPAEFWQALAQATDSNHLFTDLDYLSTQLQTRYYTTTQLNQACQFVKDEFTALGLRASFDYYTINGHVLKNILAVKPGTVDSTRIYLIEGHLDSTSPSAGTLAPGADDNGSGSIGVLEAARLLAPLATDYTIYFLCVTAEEQGMIGSGHFATQAQTQSLDIRGVLNMDMIGWYDPSGADLWIEGFHNGTSSVWLMNQLDLNARTYAGLSTYLYPDEGYGSDHKPFHDHGYPAILSIENEWDGYPCYHQTCDTVDQLDGPFWSRIAAANVITLGQLAQVQGAVGAISGTVAMNDGGNPDGVVCRLDGTLSLDQTSDSSGHFGWSPVFPASYTLVAEKAGYDTSTLEVTVPSGSTETVLITMISQQPVPTPHPTDSTRAIVDLEIAPNPVRGDALIQMTLPRPLGGALEVYSAEGRFVARLLSSPLLAAGAHPLHWNGLDEGGHEVPSGIYWLRWEGLDSAAKSFVLLR